MTIEEFIRARLDEDEQIALAAGDSRRTPGQDRWEFGNMQVRAQDSYGVLVVGHTWPREGEHIARHDPASVLRDIAARRRILAAAERVEENGGWHISGQGVEIIYALAERWNTHPDYQPGWA